MSNKLLKPEDVAEKLGMSLSWVYSKKHNIGFIQFGKAVRFEHEAVEEYARGCRRDPQLKGDRKWDTPFQKEKTVKRGLSAQGSTASALKELFAQKERQSSMH
jgi:predicted DNA-binding transcriptional regulator AlpA